LPIFCQVTMNTAKNVTATFIPGSNDGAGVWETADSMAIARKYFTATLLANGKVLVAGGENAFGITFASAELYDPATNSWSSAGTLPSAHSWHTATRLANGKVLVV